MTDTIRQNVERAAATLNEIMEEIAQEVFVSRATDYLAEQVAQANGSSGSGGDVEPEQHLASAARSAVVKRLEWLDANFLAALNAYVAAAEARRDARLGALLTVLREEVLAQVSLRLPPSVRVLDAALKLQGVQQRSDVLRSALRGGAGSLPACELEPLVTTANQFIDDMEDQQVIADRALLARLVLLREELRALAAQEEGRAAFGPLVGPAQPPAAASRSSSSGGSSGGVRVAGPQPAGPGSSGAGGWSGGVGAGQGGVFSWHRSNLPRRCAAFLKELLAVGDRPKRVALLSRAFASDWDGAGPPGPPAPVPEAASLPGGGGAGRESAPDVVRPGRFMATLHAMQSELARDGGGASAAVLARMSLVQVEAVMVLDRLQLGELRGEDAMSASQQQQ